MKKTILNFFSEIMLMLKSPRIYSSGIAENGSFSFKDIRFLLPAAAFIICSVIRAVGIAADAGSLSAVYTGIPITIESPFLVILSSVLISDICTLFAISALLSFYLPFICSGRLALKLLVIFVLIPVIYFALFLIPVPNFFRVLLSLLAFAAMFIPAIKNRQKFLTVLNAILMFYVPLLLLGLFSSIFVFAGMAKCYFVINLCSSVLSIVYFTAFCSGIFRVSPAKSFAALLAAGIFIMVYIQLLAIFGIISQDVSLILSIS